MKLQAERFLSPAEAKKGVYTLAQTCGKLFTADDAPTPFGKFTYEMMLEGFAMKADGKKDLEKRSFTISMAMEAKFDIVNGRVSKADELNRLCPEIIGQVHALGAMRLIALAADLGFPAVRPRLSIPRESIPSFMHDGTEELPIDND